MTTILNKIIQLNIELEGALRVAANRPSQEAIDSAKLKFAEISALFAMLQPSDFVAQNESEQTKLKEEEAECGESEPLDEPQIKTAPDFIEEAAAVVAPEKKFVETEEPDEETPEVEEISDYEQDAPVEQPKEKPEPQNHRERADIRKLFTLNDKFLFRRELFGNNDEEFNTTLELISFMHSFDEVQEYAYEDLGWDKADSKVKDFMDIVKGYFI